MGIFDENLEWAEDELNYWVEKKEDFVELHSRILFKVDISLATIERFKRQPRKALPEAEKLMKWIRALEVVSKLMEDQNYEEQKVNYDL